jgi:mannosyl-3-phosphoglycerate phosphatase family protein
VYTDLDGTLLDHDSYSFQAALPALQRLHALNIPVIPVTSKTLAELDTLTRKLNLGGPCIAENGGLIAYPPGYFPDLEDCSIIGHYQVQRLSPDYQTIVSTLERLRVQFGYRFEGFSDLSTHQVAQLTGLSEHDAELARQRLCSEPLVWADSEEALKQFSSQLENHQYTLVQGGRFWHVMGQTNKALAIKALNSRFSARLESGFTRIGTKAVGPAGWNEFFQHYLDTGVANSDGLKPDTGSEKTGTRHG